MNLTLNYCRMRTFSLELFCVSIVYWFLYVCSVSWKKLCFCLFFWEVSINCLFDSLESGKRNSFGKRLEIVLNFASHDCRNPDLKSITFHQIRVKDVCSLFQLSWIQQILSNPGIFCFADYPCHTVVIDLLKTVPEDDNREISTW